ncbi:MAG: hypothetical protein Q4Q20_01370 [Methanocorpusculum sp.]|nr:hypothetical protein [Methanocorpusculum sp.]
MSAEFDTSKNGLALGSFIAALVALIIWILSCIIPAMGEGTLGLIFGIVTWVAMIAAVVVGAMALKKKLGIKALAMFGFVVGIVLLAISILLFAFVLGGIVGAVVGAVLAGAGILTLGLELGA